MMNDHLLPPPFPKKERLFDCADSIEPLRCLQCGNFSTDNLVHLNQHCKANHTASRFQGDLHECRICNFRSHSNFLFLAHQLSDSCRAPQGRKKPRLGNGPKYPSKRRRRKAKWLKCAQCSYRSKMRYNLNRHINSSKHNKKSKETRKYRVKKVKEQCDHCPFKAASKAWLKRHVLLKHTNLENCQWLKCAQCQYETKTKYNLRRHIYYVHGNRADGARNRISVKTEPTTNEPEPHEHCQFESSSLTCNLHRDTKIENLESFKCPQCLFKPKTKHSLQGYTFCTHGSNTEVSETVRFVVKQEMETIDPQPCEHCPFEAPSQSSLKSHILAKHTKFKKVHWFKCVQCLYKTKAKYNLRRHMNCMHGYKTEETKTVPFEEIKEAESNEREYCEHCPFEADSKYSLKSHLLEKHSEMVQCFKCRLCPYKTQVKHNLKRHIEHKHTDFKHLKCDHCQFETKYKHSLKDHISMKHTDLEKIRWFECTQCSYKSKTNSDLKRHTIRRHNDTKHLKCDVCIFETKCQRNLKYHILSRHTERDKILCPLCPHESKSKSSMKQHMIWTHGDVKYVKCDHCPFVTKFKKSLRNHVLVKHTSPEEIEWFACEQCPYKSRIKKYLAEHVALQHVASGKSGSF